MMEVLTWRIYDAEGNWINTINGTEEFVKAYCADNGYTYKLDDSTEPELPELTSDQVALIREYKIAYQNKSALEIYMNNISEKQCHSTLHTLFSHYYGLYQYVSALSTRMQDEDLFSRMDEVQI